MDDTLYVKNPDSNMMLSDKERMERPMDIDFAGPKDDFGGAMSDFGKGTLTGWSILSYWQMWL